VSGEPAATDSREVLRRQLRRTADLGYTFYVAPEIEYYFIEDREQDREMFRRRRRGFADSPEPLSGGGSRRTDNYFDQASNHAGADLRRQTVLALEELGIPVKHSHHEVSEGQHEIDLRHTNALTMADSVITFRVVVKELASQSGGYATFMPRPFNDLNGSGMHTHMSLFNGDDNAFYDAARPNKLSVIAEQFIAGLIKHSSEITAITNQWVNSYKRLVEGTEAPVFAAWTTGHYANLVRVPAYRAGKDASVRVEYRAPDSACNPYLVFAVLLAAGLEGIEKEYELPAAIPGDPFKMTREQRLQLGLTALPSSLDEALRIAGKSELLEKVLGPAVLENFLENKRIEWSDYASTVTDYERSRYFKML
jgi:glutamine synthetase